MFHLKLIGLAGDICVIIACAVLFVGIYRVSWNFFNIFQLHTIFFCGNVRTGRSFFGKAQFNADKTQGTKKGHHKYFTKKLEKAKVEFFLVFGKGKTTEICRKFVPSRHKTFSGLLFLPFPQPMWNCHVKSRIQSSPSLLFFLFLAKAVEEAM